MNGINVTVHTGDDPGCTLCAHPEPVPSTSVRFPAGLTLGNGDALEVRADGSYSVHYADDAGAARVDWLAWLAVLGIVAAMAVGGALTGTAW